MNLEMEIRLSQQQSNFVTAKTRGRIFLSSIGSGKSYILSLSAILDALQRRRCCIVSFSYRNLKDVIIPLVVGLLTSYGIPYTYNVTDCAIYIQDSPILFRTADSPDRLRGLNLASWYGDESRELTRDTFDIMLGRLRDTENATWGLASTTRGKDWMYDLIAKENLLGIFDDNCRYIANDNVTVVRSTIDDSPFLPQAYIADLKRSYTTSFAKQELYAQILDSTGAILSPHWFSLKPFEPQRRGTRFWDLAVTTKEASDFSASCLMCKHEGKYFISELTRHKLSWPDLRRVIIQTALRDSPSVTISIEESGQQRGLIDDLRRDPALGSFAIRPYRPVKDKISRAYPFASQAELGNVVIRRETNYQALFDECLRFSVDNLGRGHDDLIDATTGAYSVLSESQTPVIKSMF